MGGLTQWTAIDVINYRDTLPANPMNGGVMGCWLNWPTNYKGWVPQPQTNSLSVGISNNWVDVIGSGATNQLTVPLNPQSPAAAEKWKTFNIQHSTLNAQSANPPPRCGGFRIECWALNVEC